MKPAISINNISKEYLLGSENLGEQSFREMLSGVVLSPFKKYRRLSGQDNRQKRFWALKDVTFEIEPGEIVGVIGKNGAGKSTLLKILSRITTPTLGSIAYRGRLASLLEVGTGFHPELTGRENIFLNGAILGMSKTEVARKLDTIVEFAGVEKFLDTPTKRFSSGMYVRLAFSVAAHLDPDILVVDEVLAVGDAEFQKRCIGKMQNVAGLGRTVIFVSHNMAIINSLCTRGLLFDKGEKIRDGNIVDVVKEYTNMSSSLILDLSESRRRGNLNDDIILESVKVNESSLTQLIYVDPQDDLSIVLTGHSNKTFEDFELLIILHKDGARLMTCNDAVKGTDLKSGNFKSKFFVPKKMLRPGKYTISIGGISKEGYNWFIADEVCGFYVNNNWSDDYLERSIGMVNPPLTGERIQN